MKFTYKYFETDAKNYQGILFEKQICSQYLQGKVKDNLLDREERDLSLAALNTLYADTGFVKNEQLLTDIQSLEKDDVNVQYFRVGEACAEITLEEYFQCRFHWNESRDARNPKGNKTGADLVGFIEINEKVTFMFGEVKTSSEDKYPPQVMTCCKDGIEKQLHDLHNNGEKRRILISYLQNKARLSENNLFKKDMDSSIKNYYSKDGGYQLIGVLIRDTEPNERDISLSYNRLKIKITEPIGLKLLALYLPIKKEKWLGVINGDKNEH